MKFSDISKEDWESLMPYLDTCLLPVTGMTGKQSPWQATKALEELGEQMIGLETAYKGRMVTYPALHYAAIGEAFQQQVNLICRNLKQTGFRHVILITASPLIEELAFDEADLVLTPATAAKGREHVRSLVEELWRESQQEAEEQVEA
ncbi:hypothetical protein J31TS4_07310 [Paenibacillus sp. J31TS4]|uniref:DUF2487 family protein n=1 Tax=Paenibacillus sp. J31TS4 TaxID=2807195 RepID=UPI001B24C97A|nr:DUF2487 family protein [Paenibacillus sp. J31TS4]GIP37451.1 hypothetical protein J31TS4_07310 [Paenibacillus sp. J31TS4]